MARAPPANFLRDALDTLRPDPVVAVEASLEQRDVVLGTDHRSRVSRQRDDRQRAKDSIDCTTLEAELAQIGPRQQGARRPDQFTRVRPPAILMAQVSPPCRGESSKP